MRRKQIYHRDMADVNVYTAKKLNDMANSLGELARACADDDRMSGQLTQEDGQAAMQTAAVLVCGSCTDCNIYADQQKEESYYLYYLLRSFEQKGHVSYEDMPRMFQEQCERKEQYIGQLNHSLGKATMNLSWKNRFLESRDAVVVQFRELAGILEEFSGQMEQAVDITTWKEAQIRKVFRKNHIQVENMLMLEYANQQREAFITARLTGGNCITSKEAAKILGEVVGSWRWSVARDSKSIITRDAATIRFVEEGTYRVLHGVAKIPKDGQDISGDNYTFAELAPGQVIMSLSDGMGSGSLAASESKRVIELTEQLLATGFSARAALKLVNTILLLSGVEQHPATLDMCCVDLYSGILEAMKLGAVATFVVGERGVEILEGGQVPAGVLNPVEPILLSKKLWEENQIVMVSDGVLEALPGDEKELVMQEYLESVQSKNPQELADQILAFACSCSGVARDDMTVLTAGIWKRA